MSIEDVPTKKMKKFTGSNIHGGQRGINEYDDIEMLIEDVKAKQLEYAMKRWGEIPAEIGDLRFCKYDVPSFGCNSKEYMAEMCEDNFYKKAK